MPEYNITWTIDLDAENPTDAVKKAVMIMQDNESTATIFDVEDQDGHKIRVDLLKNEGVFDV